MMKNAKTIMIIALLIINALASAEEAKELQSMKISEFADRLDRLIAVIAIAALSIGSSLVGLEFIMAKDMDTRRKHELYSRMAMMVAGAFLLVTKDNIIDLLLYQEL